MCKAFNAGIIITIWLGEELIKYKDEMNAYTRTN